MWYPASITPTPLISEEPEWLAVAFTTDLIGGTFFESSGTLWDDQGRLVAMSRQLQLIQRG